ncbi:MAG TPA: alpha/beta hydrolase [bacterium]|nr:alpha/beta hydrolase [bacterium]HPJ71378.1 alpha/beta hydrolase [bacterium]HPQ66436.1 alpha/beta hydrolase [bacterium]
MADYVLVHGGTISTDTWNRLAGREVYPPGGFLGARCWDGTAAALRERGHRVFAPTLADERRSDLTGHVGQVEALITGDDLGDIVLVGHSYGGMVVTGVAARLAQKVRRLVYVDAAFPLPGQSLFDLLNLGLAAAGTARPELPDPAPPYLEKLRYDPARLRSTAKTYILCTKSDFLPVTRLARSNLAAAGGEWTGIEVPSSHVPMADMPERCNRLLLSAAAAGRRHP